MRRKTDISDLIINAIIVIAATCLMMYGAFVDWNIINKAPYWVTITACIVAHVWLFHVIKKPTHQQQNHKDELKEPQKKGSFFVSK